MGRLLIPLNKCRHKTLYAPWACEDERCVKVFRVWAVVLIFSLIGTDMKSKIDGRDMKSVRELTVAS